MKKFNRNFIVLLIGEGIASVGARVVYIIVPLIAISSFGASTPKVGMLVAAGFASSSLCGIFAGGIVNRVPKRRVLIFVNAAVALLLLLVPIAQYEHFLSLSFWLILRKLLLAGAQSDWPTPEWPPSSSIA